ncbi:MAG TPA: aminotransferase class III-fold pyridoxal phosphate-dependent enzyme [Roseiflexaceae bacterium]|nr:aminotransferase class III-fold pyridoxal phosphate-dependent enzyme [Roseiflexaceae bacterium]
MGIVETYRRRHAGSAAQFARAADLVPGGLTHDARSMAPFPIYIERSAGAHKWDVDGNRLIDYWTGHGALLLGHAHPEVVAAVQEQMARGTHHGAEHPLLLRWAEQVRGLFPGIERLRFTASGTEATMMALRLARAYTGRPTVVRFIGHYHGWHDTLAHGMELDPTPPPGLPPGVAEATLPLPADLDVVAETLRTRDDIAAVILEPTGASYGMAPLPPGFLSALRDLTRASNVLLICDEVVTGFRLRPGGVQERSGVTADLTTLAKVLAGGLPGGAVGGRAEIMQLLAFGDAEWNRARKLRHNGTFNANPLSAAAGVATLARVAEGAPTAQANALGERLVAELNGTLRSRELAGWAAYGDGSIFHLVAGSRAAFAPGELPADLPLAELKGGGDSALLARLRLALLNHGVDWMRGRSGFLSAAHTEQDIDATVAAFAAALDDLGQEEDL